MINEGDILIRQSTGKKYRVTKVSPKSEERGSYEVYEIEAVSSGRKSIINEAYLRSNYGKPAQFKLEEKEQMSEQVNIFDILVETAEGLYLLMASSSNRQYAAIVAEALYATGKDETQPGRSKVAAVIVRDMENPAKPVVMDVWPEYWRDRKGYDAAKERYMKQFERQQYETDCEEALKTIPELLKKLPESYNYRLVKLPDTYEHTPPEFKQDDTSGLYSLTIAGTPIFRGVPLADALERVKRYVKEREGHPNLPVGVIDGIYD